MAKQRKVTRRIKPNPRRDKVRDFIIANPGKTIPEISRAVDIPYDEITGHIVQIKKTQKIDVKREKKRMSEKQINTTKFLLENTIKKPDEIAREVSITKSQVTKINKKFNCRSAKVSKRIGHDLRFKWELYPKTTLFSQGKKEKIIAVNTAKIFKLMDEYGPPELKKSQGYFFFLRNKIEEALDHYHEEICHLNVFVLLVTKEEIEKSQE